MLKKLKKIVTGGLAVITTSACLGMFTACETNRPKVELTVSFDQQSYTLEYNLYRKITPQTVAHFLALADAGFYKDMCVHNVGEDAWFTGAYEYKNNTLSLKDYYATAKKVIDKKVWLTNPKADVSAVPAYTLYGEFESNYFSVENGALKEERGALVMYYTQKDTDAEVYVEPNGSKTPALRDYEPNSATSQFYISFNVEETAQYNNHYCVFATLTEDSVDDFNALTLAVAEKMEEDEDFLQDVTVAQDVGDPIVGDYHAEVTYQVPTSPIKITVTVKKF